MATQNSVNIGDSARCFTGVATWGGAGAYFDDTTLGSFTVSRPGTGFILGKPVSWAGSQTITGLTAGNAYYICMDATGTIYKTTDEGEAYGGSYMPLFECMRDSTPVTNNQVTVREDHPYNMPYLVNHFLHDSIGPIIENKSKGANITLNGTQKIQINGADTLLDHGLSTTIPDSGGVAVVFIKMYTDGSGKWARQNATDTFSGYYNNAGTPTVLGGSKFGVYTLYVSKDNLNSSTPVYFAVLDTSQYNSQGLADTAIASGTVAQASNELAALELCKLGYIIYGQAANAIVQVIIAKSTFQSSITSTGTNAASLVNTSTTNFNGILSSSDTNVQVALDTIDNWGASTTDHAVLIGNGTGVAIGSLSVGTTGQVLQGVTSNDPAWSTATYPSTVSLGDVLVATADNVISVANGNLANGYVLASDGSGNPPTFKSGGFIWNYSSGTNFSCPPNQGYLLTAGSDQIIFVSNVTTFSRTFVIEVIKVTAGYLTIEQQASHQISIGGTLTTAGGSHGVKSNTTGLKRIKLQYVATNLWYVTETVGSWVIY